jgi:hypothetical protein
LAKVHRNGKVSVEIPKSEEYRKTREFALSKVALISEVSRLCEGSLITNL